MIKVLSNSMFSSVSKATQHSDHLAEVRKTNTSKGRNFSRIVMSLSLGKDNFLEAETACLDSCLSRLKQPHSLTNRAAFKSVFQKEGNDSK
jgi:hypothetical protein